MSKKICFLSIPFAFALILARGPSALADPQGVLTMVELPVDSVLAPPVGYDDNDNIQVVLRGTLPNGCYVLSEAHAELIPGTLNIAVTQKAFKKIAGICADEANLPDSMRFPVRYTSEATAGVLDKGDYSFVYSMPNGIQGTRKVAIDKAPVPAVDSRPYAAVMQVGVRNLVSTKDSVGVTISGVLNSSCTDIDAVEVNQKGDVFIVLPTLKQKPGVICTQLNIPFFRKINLGKLGAGEYLVHVRSMHGRGINQVVEVLKDH